MKLTNKRNELQRILRIPSYNRLLDHQEMLLSLTQNVAFFQKITQEHNTPEIHRECCAVMTLEEYEKQDIIINFGEAGNKFYILLTGSVSVMVPVKKKIKLTMKEATKYEQMPDDSSSFTSSDSSFESEVEIKQQNKERREGVAVVLVSELLEKLRNEDKVKKKSEKQNAIVDTEEKLIAKLFKENFRKEKKDLMTAIKEAKEEYIEIEISKLEEVSVLHQGDAFGELALISDRPRAATIVAREHIELLVLTKNQFKEILGTTSEKRIGSKVKSLKSLPYFLSWSSSSLAKLAYFFQPITLKLKQYLFNEGEKSEGIYFVKDGEFVVTKKLQIKSHSDSMHILKKDSELPIKKLKLSRLVRLLNVVIKGKNESIGGYELLNNLPTRQFSCACNSTQGEVYFVQKEHLLTKIPNFESIKAMLAEENKRLYERYLKVCEVEESSVMQELSSRESKSQMTALASNTKFTNLRSTRLPSTLRFAERNEPSNNTIHSTSPIVSLKSNKSVLPRMVPQKSTYRKLTDQEIFEAVNGRSSTRLAKPRQLLTFVHKRIPPANFMYRLRQICNNK